MTTENTGAIPFWMDPFEQKKIKWDRWLDRFELAISSANIPDAKKFTLLLQLIGQDAYNILCDKMAPIKPISSDYKTVVAKLGEIFKPKPLELVECFTFHKRYQLENESVEEFLNDLRAIVKHCEFGDYQKKALRNQFIFGIRNSLVQKQCFEIDNITLDEAYKIALAVELLDEENAKIQNFSLKKPDVEAQRECREGAQVSGENFIPSPSPPPQKRSQPIKKDSEPLVLQPNKKSEHENSQSSTKLKLTRALSIPDLTNSGKKFTVDPSQKGLMEKFIASHGKIKPTSAVVPPPPPPPVPGPTKTVQKIDHGKTNSLGRGKNMLSIDLNQKNVSTFLMKPPISPKPVLDTVGNSPPVIERDESGRPIRKGFVPAEMKIANEVKDFEIREAELRNARMQLTTPLGFAEKHNFEEKNPSMRPKMNRSKSLHQESQSKLSLTTAADFDRENGERPQKLIDKFETMIREKQKKDRAAKVH